MKAIRPMNKKDLEEVLVWRNHPSIRNNMLSQHKISKEEHIKWFESTISNSNKIPMIYEEKGIAMGYVNFNLNSSNCYADWGFYTSPDAPKGTGMSLGINALNYAFEKLNLNKLCGQALNKNTASINFHLKLGFTQEGILKGQYKQDSKYQDIICFGFLRKDWINKMDNYKNA
jgi:UDP-4-amino-4,6-dideoxy-N-acetyl-beta-L-altrosamine N-acetyltransferase